MSDEDSNTSDEDLKKRAESEFRKQYKYEDVVNVTSVPKIFGGNMAVIRSNQKVDHEELCYIYPDGTVRLFSTSEELVRFLEDKGNARILDRVFYRPVFSGLIFSFMLVAVLIAGFFTDYDEKALAILGNAVALAAGFYFGSHRSKA